MASDFISYNQLAWTEDLLSDPSEYEAEVGVYIDLIHRTALDPVRTVLHVGSGAGRHDLYFKKYFKITGLDLSVGMLNMAKKLNPEIEYIEGDMRTLRLDRRFDCVVIPDSIDYMVSLDDLKQAMQTAATHLKHDGVLLIVGKTEETFQNNNFVYTGEQGDTHVTLFENNYRNPYTPDTYRITMVYLIRKAGELTVYTEESEAGLFPQAVWDTVFKDSGFVMEKRKLDGLYDSYLPEGGEYPLTIFIGRKK